MMCWFHKWRYLEKADRIWHYNYAEYRGLRVCLKCGMKQRFAEKDVHWDMGGFYSSDGWVPVDSLTSIEKRLSETFAEFIEHDPEAATKLLPALSPQAREETLRKLEGENQKDA